MNGESAAFLCKTGQFLKKRWICRLQKVPSPTRISSQIDVGHLVRFTQCSIVHRYFTDVVHENRTPIIRQRTERIQLGSANNIVWGFSTDLQCLWLSTNFKIVSFHLFVKGNSINKFKILLQFRTATPRRWRKCGYWLGTNHSFSGGGG